MKEPFRGQGQRGVQSVFQRRPRELQRSQDSAFIEQDYASGWDLQALWDLL